MSSSVLGNTGVVSPNEGTAPAWYPPDETTGIGKSVRVVVPSSRGTPAILLEAP